MIVFTRVPCKLSAWLQWIFNRIFYSKQPLTCPCNHFRDLPRRKKHNWFSSITLQWIKENQCQTKVFWGNKTIYRVQIILPYTWNAVVFSGLGAGWKKFFYIFVLNVGKREVDSQTLEMAIKSNMLQLVDLVT